MIGHSVDVIGNKAEGRGHRAKGVGKVPKALSSFSLGVREVCRKRMNVEHRTSNIEC
jgi:hypothetical protein